MSVPDPYIPGWFLEPAMAWKCMQFHSELCDPKSPHTMFNHNEVRASERAQKAKATAEKMGVGWGSGTLHGLGQEKHVPQRPAKMQPFSFRLNKAGKKGVAKTVWDHLRAKPADTSVTDRFVSNLCQQNRMSIRIAMLGPVGAGVFNLLKIDGCCVYSLGETLPAGVTV